MLPDRTFYSNIYEPVFIIGRFLPNGTSAIAAATRKGPRGWSVAYSATGIYTVTLDQAYFQCIYAGAHLSKATAQDAHIQVGAIDVVSGPTVILKCFKTSDGTTAVALASDADTWIHFMLVLAGTVNK